MLCDDCELLRFDLLNVKQDAGYLLFHDAVSNSRKWGSFSTTMVCECPCVGFTYVPAKVCELVMWYAWLSGCIEIDSTPCFS